MLVALEHSSSATLAMQLSLSEKVQSSSENRCPSYVCMDLDGIYVNALGKKRSDAYQTQLNSRQKKQFDLYLTINFKQAWEILESGRVKFGIIGGDLEIEIKNKKASQFMEADILSSTVKLNFRKTQNKENNKQNKVILNTAKAAPNSLELQVTRSEEKLVLTLENTYRLPLKGILEQERIGIFHTRTKSFILEAKFTTSLENIQIIEIDGMDLSEISREKRAIIDRGLAKIFLKRKLQPYLSRAELKYG